MNKKHNITTHEFFPSYVLKTQQLLAQKQPLNLIALFKGIAYCVCLALFPAS
jgi:hypothetical protein